MNAVPPVLALRAVSKAYPGVQALADTHLELLPGEVHLLLGENGAGKSTLVKIMSGAVRPDSGVITLDGHDVHLSTPDVAQRAGITTVHQELSLVPDLSVAQNIFLGREIVGRGGRWLRRDAMKREAHAILRMLGVDLDPMMPVRRLSIALRQVVEIVRALSQKSRVLILDEPTSSLSEQETNELFGRMRQVKAQGVAICYITHRLEEIPRIADRVTVMRDGRVVAAGLPASTPVNELVRLMVGRALADEFPARTVTAGAPLLEVGELSVPGRVKRAALSVAEGEVLGIFGLIGAGRSELLGALAGVQPGASGQITVRGMPVRIRTVRDAISHGICLVPEDRHGSGLVLGMSIRDNICLSTLTRHSRGPVLRRDGMEREANTLIGRLRIKTPTPSTPAGSLSGGNQQKVVIARTLAAGSQILLLDEPTRGVDVGAKVEIYELINQLTSEGKAVILVSSELPEILGLSDRILVMREGSIVAAFDRSAANQEKLLSAALPESGGGGHDHR